MTLSIVYNNVPFDDTLTFSWGMGCVVRLFEDAGLTVKTTILFDTGGNGEILLSNMREMDIPPEELDAVMLSHSHGDHTGGLWKLLEQNAEVTVYIPNSFSRSFRKIVEEMGTEIVKVEEPAEILPGAYSIGVLGGHIKEQALVIESSAGPVLITGCSHPGIDVITERTAEMFDKDIYLITGGFHLGGTSKPKLMKIIKKLKALGVKKIGPSHCTGDEAIRLFREAWGDDFISAGCGAVIKIP